MTTRSQVDPVRILRDMSMARVLWVVLVVVGLVDMALVTPALRAAVPGELTAGRLFSTLAVLGGLVLIASDRIAEPVRTPFPVLLGLLTVDVGLLGYALYLPRQGLLALWRRRIGGDGA